jgi:O-methyltransferase
MKTKKNTTSAEEMYLDLLKKSLTRYIFDDGYLSLFSRTHGKAKDIIYTTLYKALGKFNLELVKHNQFNPSLREVGKDWPANAETMIGLKRLDNIQFCLTDIINKKVPGDVIETGVWRGGATIFMRAILQVYNVHNRTVWVADSFKGLPKTTDESHKQDIIDRLWSFHQLRISKKEVQNNFAKYGLLDDKVKFLEGWFKDTLPKAPIKKLSMIRLDGDMYDSTMDALNALYPKLSKGGYVIVDDFCLQSCRDAIKDFRAEHKIKDPLVRIDWASVYWQKK